MPPKTDSVWNKNDACIICSTICKTPEEKRTHENLQQHIKKFNIHSFFASNAAEVLNNDTPSELLKRFLVTKEKAVGLECLHELHFPWAPKGWWACSICFESGSNFEQAEDHVRSLQHLLTYVDEFHPSVAQKLEKSDQVKLYDQLIEIRKELYAQQDNKLLAPEILRVNLTKEEAMAKLVTTPTDRPFKLHPYSQLEGPKRSLLQCTVCYEVIPCFKKTHAKVWGVHENTPRHRAAVGIQGVLKQFNLRSVCDDEMTNDEGPYHWKSCNYHYFGPTCGINYLVRAGADCFCNLCFCLVDNLESHFSSEAHIGRFLSTKNVVQVFDVWQKSGDERRKVFLDLCSQTTLDNEKPLILDCPVLPAAAKELALAEEEHFPFWLPEPGSFGFDGHCLLCLDCFAVIKLDPNCDDNGESAWDEHISASSHFDFMARRATFKFYDDFFVPMRSSVKTATPETHGKWIDVPVDASTSYRIQTQSDVGLQWIVEDEERQEVICTLCARAYKKGHDDVISNHIRSFIHLSQYLNVHNRELAAIISDQSSETAVQDLMLEWLQRNSKMSESQVYDPAFMQSSALNDNFSQIKVYSPDKAMTLFGSYQVLSRTVSFAYLDPAVRPLAGSLLPVIDEIANDGVENQAMSLREALMISPCRILQICQGESNPLAPVVAGIQNARWILRCMTCQLCICTNLSSVVQDVFERHLQFVEHDRRVKAFESCLLSMYGITEESSTYTVKQFMQKDPTKKVTWQWNPKEKKHDFVLTVVGLEDIVERRSLTMVSDHTADFFCRLCATTIPRRAASLESHVRSAAHVICYVHKYHPAAYNEIELIKNDDAGRGMRKIVSQLLRNVNPTSEYCIPVFDPVGEQERKGIVAMQKAKAEERQKKFDEVRKAANIQRQKRDEERRKQREELLIKEKEEKLKREKLEAEKKRLRALAEENLRKAREEQEAKKKKEEDEKAAIRAREKEHMRQILEQEKARAKMIMARDKAVKLVQEKIQLQKRMNELQKQQQQTAIHPTAPLSFNSMYPGMVPPPMCPPPMNPMMPAFPSFTPQIDQIPIYPPKDSDAMDMSRSPSPEPKEKGKFVAESFKPIGRVDDIVRGTGPSGRRSLAGQSVDDFARNFITSREQLLTYMSKKGGEAIPFDELPNTFNEKATNTEGVVGVGALYEVVCLDDPNVDTFYCSLCAVWTTPSAMLVHLQTSEHKLAYLFRNYKMYHDDLKNESQPMFRELKLNQYITEIWKRENPRPRVVNRMRVLLDKRTIARIWPDYATVLDHSWRGGAITKSVSVPEPIAKEAITLGSPTDSKESSSHKDKDSAKKRRSHSRDREERKRKKSRSPERRRKSRSPRHRHSRDRRSRSREKRSRSRDHDRRRSRSRSRDRRRRSRSRDRERHSDVKVSKSSLDANWMETAAAFLEKLGDSASATRIRGQIKTSSPITQTPPPSTSQDQVFSERLAQIRTLAAPSKNQPQPECITLDSSPGSRKAKKSSTAAQSAMDEKTEMRKLLGVLITMQQEAERTGHLDQSRVDQLYREVGLQKKDAAAADQLLSQLVSQLSGDPMAAPKHIDLQAFGITGTPSEPSAIPYGAPPPQISTAPSSSSAPKPNIGEMLSSISGTLSNLRKQRAPSPVVKPPPFMISRTEDFYKDSDVSYVYPEPESERTPGTPNSQHSAAESLQNPPQSKKEKAALRKQLLLEQAERLRKQAEAADDDDDDEWDAVGSELNQMFEQPSVASPPTTPSTSTNTNTSNKPTKSKPTSHKFGNPSSWAQPVPQPQPQPQKNTQPQPEPVVVQPTVTEQPVPIAPGQKMPLARTMLPNGKLPPGVVTTAHQPIQQQSSQPAATSGVPTQGNGYVWNAQAQAFRPQSQTMMASAASTGYTQYSQPPPQSAMATQMYGYQQPQQYVQPQMQQQYYAQPGVPGYAVNPYVVQQTQVPQQMTYPMYSQQQQYYQPR